MRQLTDDKARALEFLSVSRETQGRLESFVAVLLKWRRRVNLVSSQAVEDLWWRHIADSAQLLSFVCGSDGVWVDLGSGAGFPGAILAILMSESAGSTVHLIESDHRKCAFLRAVSRETGTSFLVHCGRIEATLPNLGNIDVITSRAVAPLPQLLDWSQAAIGVGAKGLFPKGKRFRDELTGYRLPDRIQLRIETSKVDPEGSVIIAYRA